MRANEFLSAIVKNSKFKQEQIAKCLHVDQSTISKWLSGERKIGSEDFIRFLSLLGYSTSDFINEKTSSPLHMSFRGKQFEAEDIQAIGIINRLIANLRLMEEIESNESRN